jgi:hypothetical protein
VTVEKSLEVSASLLGGLRAGGGCKIRVLQRDTRWEGALWTRQRLPGETRTPILVFVRGALGAAAGIESVGGL